jgi:hypothetical protein
MRNRDIVLLAGAVASGLQAVSIKTTDPRISMLFTFLGVVLAFLAAPPRDENLRERSTDVESARLTDDGNSHHEA